MERKLPKTDFSHLGKGAHICSIYRSRQEQLSVLVPYLVDGLRNNEKCLSIVSEETKRSIISFLAILGLDVERCIQWGQFAFPAKEETYLLDGCFVPERMISLVKESEGKACRDGFNGLRGTGEMDWFFSRRPGTGLLMEYEAKLNHFLHDRRTIALCQYDENIFGKDILLKALHTHPKVIIYGELCDNPHYMPPDEFLQRQEKDFSADNYDKLKEAILAGKGASP